MPDQVQPQQIIAAAKAGSLGTLDQDGAPFVSLVTVAAVSPTSLVMLLSGLARHTKNLRTDSRCSLLLVESGGESGNPLAGARLTISGVASPVVEAQRQEARSRFLSVHPSAAGYADFDDFEFFQLDIGHVHLVAGFGRIETISASQL